VRPQEPAEAPQSPVSGVAGGVPGSLLPHFPKRPGQAEQAKSTNRSPASEPAPAADASAEDTADQALDRLTAGRITYDPPRNMKVGVATSIQVRIIGLASTTQAALQQAEQKLKAGLERPALASQPLRVSTTMKVVLSGKPDEFRVEHDGSDSPDEQLVGTRESTEWRWNVTPLKAGTRKLHLSAVAIVKLDGAEKEKQFAVYDTDIDVHVNIIQFTTDHWKEISSAASATGVGGWLAAWWKRRRKQPEAARAAKAG